MEKALQRHAGWPAWRTRSARGARASTTTTTCCCWSRLSPKPRRRERRAGRWRRWPSHGGPRRADLGVAVLADLQVAGPEAVAGRELDDQPRPRLLGKGGGRVRALPEPAGERHRVVGGREDLHPGQGPHQPDQAGGPRLPGAARVRVRAQRHGGALRRSQRPSRRRRRLGD